MSRIMLPRISPQTSTRLAAGVAILALLMLLAALAFGAVLELDPGYGAVWTPLNIFDVLYPAVFAGVGSLIAIKRPGNLVGWAMLLSGAGSLFGGVLGDYAELALLAKPEANLPGGVAAAVISAGSWTLLMAGIFSLLLVFPTGRVTSRLWRTVAVLVLICFALIWAAIATVPSYLDPPFQDYYNTLALAEDDSYFGVVFAIISVCLFAIVAAAIDLFLRFMRSLGAERDQFKWLALTAGCLAASIPFSGTAGFGILSVIGNVGFGIGLFGIPVSVGIAVMRYRLYDIDRIINRTLVYVLLTAGLAVIYFCLVVGLQAALRSVSGGSDLAIVVTTLVVAALFLPARRRIQTVVDRRFNRRTYDAARTIDAFSARLRQQIDLDSLRYELLSVVDGTMQPSQMALWLRQEAPS
jgi:hypothetical protein